jgi:hypothetical protein
MMMKKIKKSFLPFGKQLVKSNSQRLDYVMISTLMLRICNGKDG